MLSLSYGGKNITTKGVEKLCLELSAHYIEGTKTFGELWSKSLTTYLSTAVMDQIDYITIEEFQPFGDPSLVIAGDSQPPDKPDAPEGTGVTEQTADGEDHITRVEKQTHPTHGPRQETMK